MIRVIFGHYNPKNPLFGFHNGDVINATDILPSEMYSFTNNLMGMVNKRGVFNFYIGNNDRLVKIIADNVENDTNLQDKITLIYDNGNKFWGCPYEKVDEYIEQMRKDEELGLV